MNTIILAATFVHKPSSETQQEIEKKMRTFLLEMNPELKLKVMCGEGSWWIVVEGMLPSAMTWVISGFANWLLNAGLDKGRSLLSKKLEQPQPCGLTESASQEGAVIPSPPELDRIVSSQGKEDLMNLASRTAELKKDIKATEITFSEWSSAEQRGRSMSMRGEDDNLKCHFYQTDSQENFESYINRIQ